MSIPLRSFAASRRKLLADALTAVTGACVKGDADRLSCRLGERQRRFTALLDEQWLTIELAYGRRRAVSALQIRRSLERNATLPGGVRITSARDGLGRALICELPTQAMSWRAPQLLESELGMAITAIRSAGPRQRCGDDSPAAAAQLSDELQGLFEEAGWPLRSGEAESAHVPLDVPNTYIEAVIAIDGPVLRLSTAPFEAQLTGAVDVCRRSVYAVVWKATSRTRLVKPLLRDGRLILEAASTPIPAAVAHACSALSVALSRFVDETAHLCVDPDLARAYSSVVDGELGI